MKNMLLPISLILLLNLSLVSAITQQELNEAKNFIDSKADCKILSDSQLELIGEYYMEQMHPGESHELMHKMMGIEEGSEAEEQFHINMAKTIYCGESGGMMGGGMMNMMYGGNSAQANMTQQMMGNRGYSGYGWNIWSILYAILIIGLIILTYLGIIKLWKDLFGGKGK